MSGENGQGAELERQHEAKKEARKLLVFVRLATEPGHLERTIQELQDVLKENGLVLTDIKTSEDELQALLRNAHLYEARNILSQAFDDVEDMNVSQDVEKAIEHIRLAGSNVQDFLGISEAELIELIGPSGVRE